MDDFVSHREPLQGDDIRVLILEPTDPDLDDAFVQCRLVTTSIDSPTQYEALSYTWGSNAPSPERSIDCDGEVTEVTINLYEALLALRYPDKPRTLWIDALCIDQGNNNERNHQVSLMARIYRKAACVLLWLGKEGPALDGARSFSILRHLYNAVRTESHPERGRDTTYMRSPVFVSVQNDLEHEPRAFRKAQDNAQLGAGSASVLHSLTAVSLDALLQRTWFRRRWVLQEVYHAREAIVICGRQTMPWEAFVVAFLRLYSADHRYRLPLPIF